MKTIERHMWRAAIFLGILLAVGTVKAQEEATDEEKSRGELEEIIVTSEFREVSVQDIPIAVTAYTGDMLDARGWTNIVDVTAKTPNVTLREAGQARSGMHAYIRGIGQPDALQTFDPAVGIYLDDVFISRIQGALFNLYDIERVEVLRGPQGTLFGKNASAGVVNVVSKRPGDELGGYVDLGWYEDNEMRLKAALDAPISDKLRTRTTATWGNFDGYIDNISDTKAGGDLNGYDRWGVRTVWEADPTDNVKLTFIGDYRKSDDNCCVEVIAGPLSGAQAAAVASLLEGTDYDKGFSSRKVRQNLEMRSEEEAWGLSLQADIGLGDYTLTSITAYRTWDSTEIREGDWLDAGAAYVGINQLHDFGPQTQETFSQELRIASPGGEFVDYVAGLYYATTDAERFFRRDTIVCRSSTLAASRPAVRIRAISSSVLSLAVIDHPV